MTVSSLFGPHRPSQSSSRQTSPDNKAPQGPRRPRLSSFRCNCQIAVEAEAPEPDDVFATQAPRRIAIVLNLVRLALGRRANRSAPASRQGRELVEFARKPRVPRFRSNAVAPSVGGYVGKPPRRVKRFFKKSARRANQRAQMARLRGVAATLTATRRTTSAPAAARRATPCDRRRATCRRGARRSG